MCSVDDWVCWSLAAGRDVYALRAAVWQGFSGHACISTRPSSDVVAGQNLILISNLFMYKQASARASDASSYIFFFEKHRPADSRIHVARNIYCTAGMARAFILLFSFDDHRNRSIGNTLFQYLPRRGVPGSACVRAIGRVHGRAAFSVWAARGSPSAMTNWTT
jgi:hypothetical protein